MCKIAAHVSVDAALALTNEAEGQRAGPARRPAWLAGGEWPGRCDFVRDGRVVPPTFFPVALSGTAQLRAGGIPADFI